jgi:hypothetical protein
LSLNSLALPNLVLAVCRRDPTDTLALSTSASH